MSNTIRRILAALTAVAVAFGAATFAVSQDKPAEKPQAKPSFDYWQPEWMMRELWGPGQMPKGMMVRLLRHTTFTQFGVPKDYENALSPLKLDDKAAVAAGGKIYAAQCASCHGRDGQGDGAAPRSLLPSPALLAFMVTRPIAVDSYLLWAIADGGKQFESEMPAYKERLTRDEIWRVVAYLRAGFPETR